MRWALLYIDVISSECLTFSECRVSSSLLSESVIKCLSRHAERLKATISNEVVYYAQRDTVNSNSAYWRKCILTPNSKEAAKVKGIPQKIQHACRGECAGCAFKQKQAIPSETANVVGLFD
jgi:hypothetical protein